MIRNNQIQAVDIISEEEKKIDKYPLLTRKHTPTKNITENNQFFFVLAI